MDENIRKYMNMYICSQRIWESSSDAGLLAEARREIARSVARSHRGTQVDLDDPDAVLRFLNDKGANDVLWRPGANRPGTAP